MLKTLLFSVALTALLGVATASAQPVTMKDCDDANMMNANAMVDKMPDGDKKTMAMSEMAMAKDMRAKKDMEQCKLHMDKAMATGMPR